LEKPNFDCEPTEEAELLFKLFGWEIKRQGDTYDFISIIEECKQMETHERNNLNNFQEFLCREDLLSAEQIIIENSKTMKFIVEEIDEFSFHPKTFVKRHYSLISTNLYLLGVKFSFNLQKLPMTLEQLVQEYSSQVCSLCSKTTNEAAVCLICNEFMCLKHCSKDGMLKRRINPVAHSNKCHGGTSIFIIPTFGRIVYISHENIWFNDSPYVNQNGNTYLKNENAEMYKLDETWMKWLRKDYLTFDIYNLVYMNSVYQIISEEG
jgi:hypothetical protein